MSAGEYARIRHELAELAKAIGDRELELKHGSPIVYDCALDTIVQLSQTLMQRSLMAKAVKGAKL